MCGIVGYSLNEKSDLPISAISKSLAVISHRGPDDKGEYFTNDYKYGLGQVRLSIIDTSLNGHQPMISKCKK